MRGGWLLSLAVALCFASWPGAAGAATPAPASSAAAPAASAAAPAGLRDAAVTANWAGYAASGTHFSRVLASWVEPVGACSNSKPGYSAFWIGLGGYSSSSQALEQTGTEVDCTSAGKPVYYAWYELVPAAPVTLKIRIRSGDRIFARVSASGRRVSLALHDATSGGQFDKGFTMNSPRPDTTSAEWITEAPSVCNAFGNCDTLPLGDFAAVAFTDASATNVSGHTGAINDRHWSHQALELQDQTGSLRPGRFPSPGAAAEALPGALSSAGSAFGVSWQQITGSSAPTGGGPFPHFISARR